MSKRTKERLYLLAAAITVVVTTLRCIDQFPLYF